MSRHKEVRVSGTVRLSSDYCKIIHLCLRYARCVQISRKGGRVGDGQLLRIKNELISKLFL